MPLSDAELDAIVSGKDPAPENSAPPAEKPSRSVVDEAIERTGDVIKGALPPTAGPAGALLNKVTGGAYGKIAPEHGGVYQADKTGAPERKQGESDANYSRRTALEQGTSVGADRGFAAAGLVAGNAPEIAGTPKPSILSPAVRDYLQNKSINIGRRVLTGGAEPLSVKNPLSPEAVQTAFDVGAIAPGRTTKYAADTLREAREAAGKTLGGIIDKLEAAGVRGPNAVQLAQALRQKADTLEMNSAGTGAPALYRSLADEIESKVAGRPAFTPGRQNLDVSQAEAIKRSLQEKARYDRVQGDTILEGARKDIASHVRQSVEDAIQNQAHLAPEAAADFVPTKESLGNIIEASEVANKGAAQAARRNAFSLRDIMLGSGMSAGGAAALGPLGALAGPATAVASQAVRTRGTPTAAWLLNKAAQLGELPKPMPTGSATVGPVAQAPLGPLGSSPIHAAAAAADNPSDRSPEPSGPQSQQGAPSSWRDATPAGEHAQPVHVDPSERVSHALQTNPSLLGPYAGEAATRLRVGGPKALQQWMMLKNQTDPSFRETLRRLGGDEKQ